MFFSTTPITFDTGAQLSPDKINDLILQASKELQREGSQRYRTFEIAYPVMISTKICSLPSIDDIEYIVESITLTGTYADQPSVSWQYRYDSEARQTVQFPANGNNGESYTCVIRPQAKVSGPTGTLDLIVTSTTALASMRAVVICKSVRGALSDNPIIPNVSLYKDQQVLTAAAFNAVKTTLSNYQTEIDPTTRPTNIWGVSISNVASTTDVSAREIRFPGVSIDYVTRIYGRAYKIDGNGAGGQTYTFDYGFNTPSTNTGNYDFSAVSETYFDTGPISISRPNASFSSSNDLVLRVSTSAATTISRFEIYVVGYS